MSRRVNNLQEHGLANAASRFDQPEHERDIVAQQAIDFVGDDPYLNQELVSPLPSIDGVDDEYLSAPCSQKDEDDSRDGGTRCHHVAKDYDRTFRSFRKLPRSVTNKSVNLSRHPGPRTDVYSRGQSASRYRDLANDNAHARNIRRQRVQDLEYDDETSGYKLYKEPKAIESPMLSPKEKMAGLHRPRSAPSPWNTIGKITKSRVAPDRLCKDSFGTSKVENQSGKRSTFNAIPVEINLKADNLKSPQRNRVARKWSSTQKRWTAVVACLNTFTLGFQIGIYAGMVPQIQYQLADMHHYVIQGNVYFYIALAISTAIFWPLPLLYGRKPYVLASYGFCIPLQFPQAIIVMAFRNPRSTYFHAGLLVIRMIVGFLLGFANVNFFTVLLDLFGASLQSHFPHQEHVDIDNLRHDGGGMGMWLGFWCWCYIGSISVGFASGAAIIHDLNPQYGFYIAAGLMTFVLALNLVTPETRRSPWRRHTRRFYDNNEQMRRIVGRGEVKLHISTRPPRNCWEEIGAGLQLSLMMLSQRGFLVMALYVGWIYAQLVLVIVVSILLALPEMRCLCGQLLAALLSREYRFRSYQVAGAVLSIACGALLAIPLSRANWLSRARTHRSRTNSVTLVHHQITWTSHMTRRITFMLTLPFAGLAYTLASSGQSTNYLVPTIFAGVMGFLSNLALAECFGLIMETFDTSDLQPGVNNRHRLTSMPNSIRRRRTNYSSFPRISAGFFMCQMFSFLFAALFTGIGGAMTRSLGSRLSSGVTAAILLGLTTLLTLVLWRFKLVKVVPDKIFGTEELIQASNRLKRRETSGGQDWKPVIIGNSSHQVRRMNVLELGQQSRWTEIRRLNRLIRD